MARRTVNERLKETNSQIALAFLIALAKLGGTMKVSPADLEAVGKHQLLIKEIDGVAHFTMDPPPSNWLKRLFGAKL